MKRILFLVAVGGLSLLADVSHAQSSENEKLQAFFKTYLEQNFHQQPMAATGLGDHRFDAQLDDISPAARAKWKALTEKTLKELPRAVDYKKLSRASQIDFEILRQDLQRDLWLTENFRPFEEDPRTYGRYINDSIYVLLTQSTLPAETNIANCIARMKEIPRAIATAKQTLTRPPKPILETAIRQNRGAVSFFESELFQLVGETPQLPQLKTAAVPIVAALKDYQQFLETELMPRATGEWRIGKKKFAKKLELVLDAGMTADQVLADAEAEFTRVQRDK